MEKQDWLDEQFTPFDQGAREKFFLAATSFLYTHREDRLSDGYYFEFGTHKGRTMRHCWRHTRHNFNFTYVGFDSFAGLPDMGEEDRHPGWNKGDFSVSERDFTKAVLADGMPADRLTTVPGFYDTSLTDDLAASLKPRMASIVYVDCDLYTSTVDVLKFAHQFLQRGTLIAFDDWNCYFADPDKGQRRAWREFLERHPGAHFEPFYATHMMQAFVCVHP